jgi:hypothetical protein
MTISRLILLIREIFQTKFVEKIKTHILCSLTFFRKSCRLWDNVEKYGKARKATRYKIRYYPSYGSTCPSTGPICSSETSVLNQLTLRNNPEDEINQFNRLESLISQKRIYFYLFLLPERIPILKLSTYSLITRGFILLRYTTQRHICHCSECGGKRSRSPR